MPPQRRALMFGPDYGTAPFTAGKPSMPPLPPPNGQPPMRLPISSGTTPPETGGHASAAPTPSSSPGEMLDGDPYTQLIQLLQMSGKL